MTNKLYSNLDDTELWELLRDGDRNALNEIYHQNIDVLYSYGAKITSDNGLVEDSIQEVFITVWEKRHKLKETTSIKFYLFKSLKRRIFRNLKNGKLFSILKKIKFYKIINSNRLMPCRIIGSAGRDFT